jgi:hypothetical protein
MWLLLVPILILVAVVVLVTALAGALIGLVGAALGALGLGWPWLLIALGIWLFWHEDGRYRRRRHRREAIVPPRAVIHDRHKPAERQQPEKNAAPLSGPRPMRQTELPIDVQVKVEQIRRKVDVLLGYADRFPPFSQDLYLVRQTASDYLPRTINAYLALPKQTAEKPLSADGKTAHQELRAQLDLLDSKLDDIAQDLQRQDTDRLLANRRFLEERFGAARTHKKTEVA